MNLKQGPGARLLRWLRRPIEFHVPIPVAGGCLFVWLLIIAVLLDRMLSAWPVRP